MTKVEVTTREEILRHARHLFADAGFDGTSVRDIVSAAGVNVSLVSYYFSGKEGLYRECLKEAGARRVANAEQQLQPAKNAAELKSRVTAYVRDALNVLAEDRDSPKLIAAELDRGRDLFADVLKDVFFKVHLAIATFLEAAQKQGLVRRDIDPRGLASMIQGLISNESRLDRAKERFYGLSLKDTKHREDCVAQIVALFLNGAAS